MTLLYSTLKYTLRVLRYMWFGLLTDRINNKLEKSNLIHEHALNHEPVPLKASRWWLGSGSCLNTLQTSGQTKRGGGEKEKNKIPHSSLSSPPSQQEGRKSRVETSWTFAHLTEILLFCHMISKQKPFILLYCFTSFSVWEKYCYKNHIPADCFCFLFVLFLIIYVYFSSLP